MNEGSGYCGSGSEIESVSNAAKNANMVMTALERDEIFLQKDWVESNVKARFLANWLIIMG